jgi:hypothetical protein
VRSPGPDEAGPAGSTSEPGVTETGHP